jgi:hypothetical protein
LVNKKMKLTCAVIWGMIGGTRGSWGGSRQTRCHPAAHDRWYTGKRKVKADMRCNTVPTAALHDLGTLPLAARSTQQAANPSSILLYVTVGCDCAVTCNCFAPGCLSASRRQAASSSCPGCCRRSRGCGPQAREAAGPAAAAGAGHRACQTCRGGRCRGGRACCRGSAGARGISTKQRQQRRAERRIRVAGRCDEC